MQELAQRQATPADEVRLVELPGRKAAVVRFSGTTAEMPAQMGHAFATTAAAIGAAGAAIIGPPFARYFSFGERIEAEAGFPFEGTVPEAGEIVVTELPGGRLVTTRFVGAYDRLKEPWDRSEAWMREHELKPTGAPWECYLTGPDEPGPPITEIFWPLD